MDYLANLQIHLQANTTQEVQSQVKKFVDSILTTTEQVQDVSGYVSESPQQFTGNQWNPIQDKETTTSR